MGKPCNGCECNRRCCGRFFQIHRFTLALILCAGIGIGMGVALRHKYPPWTSREILYLQFPGELMARMLRMVTLPLIVASIINGISNMKGTYARKIGGRTLLYFLSTTLIASIIGIIMVASIRPGNYNKKSSTRRYNILSAVDSLLLDVLRNYFPDNIFAAFFQLTTTVLKPPQQPIATPSEIAANITPTQIPAHQWPASVITVSIPNSFGLIVFSIAFGAAINTITIRGYAVGQLFAGATDALMTIVPAIIWYTPIGVIFLLASKVVAMTNPIVVLSRLAVYIATVIGASAIHAFIILPLIYFIFVRRNPFSYIFGTTKALMIALSTASSSATLPVTLHCTEDINLVDKRVARLVISIGSSFNLDGTAIYIAVASAFVAQMNDMPLHFGQYIVIWLAAAATSFGTSGIPSAGLMNLVVALEAASLPLEDISLLLSVDWILDRLMTTINVLGDAIGAAIVERLSRDDLIEMNYLEITRHNYRINNSYQEEPPQTTATQTDALHLSMDC